MNWKLDSTPAPIKVNELFDHSIAARELSTVLYEMSMTAADTYVIGNPS